MDLRESGAILATAGVAQSGSGEPVSVSLAARMPAGEWDAFALECVRRVVVTTSQQSDEWLRMAQQFHRARVRPVVSCPVTRQRGAGRVVCRMGQCRTPTDADEYFGRVLSVYDRPLAPDPMDDPV